MSILFFIQLQNYKCKNTTEDVLTFQENLSQYSLLLPLDPVLVQKIVSRHLKLPKNENKHTDKEIQLLTFM